jgi:hypothetical protein
MGKDKDKDQLAGIATDDDTSELLLGLHRGGIEIWGPSSETRS